MSEDLAAWPDNAWMVIDDYHHVGESATAEAFVEAVVQHSPLQMLISTRDRPRWVSTRSVLYGEVLEIGQSALAMSEVEVDELLAGGRDAMSPGLLALAGGWPAVIGLASLTTSPTSAPVGELEVPDQLYEFFAEEVYRGLEPDDQSRPWPPRDRAEPRPGARGRAARRRARRDRLLGGSRPSACSRNEAAGWSSIRWRRHIWSDELGLKPATNLRLP